MQAVTIAILVPNWVAVSDGASLQVGSMGGVLCIQDSGMRRSPRGQSRTRWTIGNTAGRLHTNLVLHREAVCLVEFKQSATSCGLVVPMVLLPGVRQRAWKTFRRISSNTISKGLAASDVLPHVRTCSHVSFQCHSPQSLMQVSQGLQADLQSASDTRSAATCTARVTGCDLLLGRNLIVSCCVVRRI